jgi:catechol 2,3-dioxygenase-like lactoylglutathione lyase family enzyme
VSTEYRLNHFGLLCQDVRRGLATYCDDLGNEMTSRWYNRGLFDLAFVGNGPDTTIELVGPPFLPYEEAHLARHGYSINHLSFRVDDADVAFEELRGQGVQVAWEPQDMLLLRQCGFLDEDGLLFEVFSYLSPLPLAVPDVSRPHKATDLRLHHVSILTPDLRRSQRFYTETLGMRTLLEYVQDDGGFIFLVDPAFDLDRHSCWKRGAPATITCAMSPTTCRPPGRGPSGVVWRRWPNLLRNMVRGLPGCVTQTETIWRS